MTFLQPFLLAVLPLAALPIIIHLINQRRYQTIRWAGMMFLLAATKMAKGYAKLRQILILLFRMLAIAGLVFAVSRPLAGGWLGRTVSGRPDTTIIILDRSPSMGQQDEGTSTSKLDAGREQLARSLSLLPSNRWVFIESTSNKALELGSPNDLLNLSDSESAGSSADLPAMLEAARDYVQANQTGRTEIWLCSDTRANDWAVESVRWDTLRDAFNEFPQGIRFHLLAYADNSPANVSVRVTNARRIETGDNSELLVSLGLNREKSVTDTIQVPVVFEIEGARSELMVEMNGPTFELKDHAIPIERSKQRGWGKVSIPADANPADNEFYFVFDRPHPRRTLIVSEDQELLRAMELAASISPDPAIQCAVETIEPGQVETADWSSISLLIWHAAFPDAESAESVKALVDRGGQVVFLPPTTPTDDGFINIQWQDWAEESPAELIESWRGDQDVLANTRSGAALPVGDLEISRYRGLQGELTSLAGLKDGQPIIAKVPTDRGGVYFCATTPAARDSSLARNGIVLYVFVHRLMAEGASVLAQARHLVAGDSSGETPATWRRIIAAPGAISSDYVHHAGVYQSGEKLLAVNRAASEDDAEPLPQERVARLFEGLDFTRVDERSGNLAGLIQEIWRLFLVVMLTALIVEACLCIPRRATNREPGTFGDRA